LRKSLKAIGCGMSGGLETGGRRPFEKLLLLSKGQKVTS
jgi:hypothetical protein